MRSQNDHLKQAADNEQFAQSLLQIATPDSITWAVTTLFYAAVHYGRAYLVFHAASSATTATTITTHPGFESAFVNRWPVPPNLDIFPNYRRLKDHSERARYDCIAYTAKDIEDLRDNHLVPFRNAVKAAMGIP